MIRRAKDKTEMVKTNSIYNKHPKILRDKINQEKSSQFRDRSERPFVTIPLGKLAYSEFVPPHSFEDKSEALLRGKILCS